MTGIQYWRIVKNITPRELATAAGISIWTLLSLEKEIKESTGLNVYSGIAAALGVTIEMVISEYDKPDGIVNIRRGKCRKELDGNVVAVYCKRKNLTFQELADQLGVTSRERARQICRAPEVSKKHISKLAEIEGLSLEEFNVKYAA